MLFIVGVMIGGWWIGLGALVLYFFVLAAGYVVAASWLGNLLLARSGKGAAYGWSLLLGLAVVGLGAELPFAGPLVCSAAVLFGVGALALAWCRARRGARSAPEVRAHAAPLAT